MPMVPGMPTLVSLARYDADLIRSEMLASIYLDVPAPLAKRLGQE